MSATTCSSRSGHTTSAGPSASRGAPASSISPSGHASWAAALRSTARVLDSRPGTARAISEASRSAPPDAVFAAELMRNLYPRARGTYTGVDEGRRLAHSHTVVRFARLGLRATTARELRWRWRRASRRQVPARPRSPGRAPRSRPRSRIRGGRGRRCPERAALRRRDVQPVRREHVPERLVLRRERGRRRGVQLAQGVRGKAELRVRNEGARRSLQVPRRSGRLEGLLRLTRGSRATASARA